MGGNCNWSVFNAISRLFSSSCSMIKFVFNFTWEQIANGGVSIWFFAFHQPIQQSTYSNSYFLISTTKPTRKWPQEKESANIFGRRPSWRWVASLRRTWRICCRTRTWGYWRAPCCCRLGWPVITRRITSLCFLLWSTSLGYWCWRGRKGVFVLQDAQSVAAD